MIKVLHFCSSIGRGGAERQLITIVRNSTNLEHYIVALRFDENNYLREGENIHYLSNETYIGRIKEFKRYIEQVNPDVVYAWSLKNYLIASMSNFSKRYKLINGSIRYGVFNNGFFAYFQMFVLHTSKYIVANSKAGLKAHRLKRGWVLYNGVDPDFYRDHKIGDKKQSEGSFVIASVANLVSFKDYPTVFKALKLLSDDGFDFKYFIMGDGPLKGSYQESAKQIGIRNKVEFLGNIKNPQEYLAKSDLLVHSSRGEGCPNAILEAMFMGLPIIATNTGGTAEVLGDNAFLFAYKDHIDLYNKMKIVMLDDSLREKMSKESLRLAHERFTVHRMISDYERIIEEVLGVDVTRIVAE